jgi:hypothetical protein
MHIFLWPSCNPVDDEDFLHQHLVMVQGYSNLIDAGIPCKLIISDLSDHAPQISDTC